MARVIAIAGPPGSGKSTLAHALARELGSAAVLEFDEFEQATARSVPDLERWLADGADFDQLAAPGLRDRLQQLAADPARAFVLFEMPLGRAHSATAPLIDLLLWIDLPADLALARKLQQILAAAAHREPACAAAWLAGYVAAYLQVVHRVLALQRDRVRPGADLCVDGTNLRVPQLARELRRQLEFSL